MCHPQNEGKYLEGFLDVYSSKKKANVGVGQVN